MSVVRGPWIAINVRCPSVVRGPWIDSLLSPKQSVVGCPWTTDSYPLTATVYDTTGTKCGAVNVAQLNFIVHFKNATAQATPIFDVAVDCSHLHLYLYCIYSPAGEFLFDTEARTEVHETRVLENVLRELAPGNHDAE